MQIYVGNLPSEFTDDDLRGLFTPHGTVKAATMGKPRTETDKEATPGGEKGYGFVEMEVKSEARAAVEALRGKELSGSPIRVRILKPNDDLFHHAVDLHTKGRQMGGKLPASRQYRGDVTYRGSGAIRRGGKRGS